MGRLDDSTVMAAGSRSYIFYIRVYPYPFMPFVFKPFGKIKSAFICAPKLKRPESLIHFMQRHSRSESLAAGEMGYATSEVGNLVVRYL